MTDIKRYEISGLGGGIYAMMPAEDGSNVKYEDHAAVVAELQEQVQKLAAENAAMKSEELVEFLRLVECMNIIAAQRRARLIASGLYITEI